MNATMNKPNVLVLLIVTAAAMFFFTGTVSAQSESLLLVGPASKAKDNSLEIMGQVVVLESSAANDAAKALGSDSYVAVFGSISKKGELASTRIEVLDAQYVPGSSPVMVSGLLEESTDKNGRVSLGELTMDLTLSLYTVTESYPEGLYLCIGTQPNPDGIMLANSAQGFEANQDFSEFQDSYSGEFLASIESGALFSIGGGGGVSIGGGGGVSIGGGGGVSIGGRDKSDYKIDHN